ncbi:MAG: hypothetical protein KDA57_12105 [Planctomycetales bacterium]|nr:hypothetical protein [Planctomycetales bacterium]
MDFQALLHQCRENFGPAPRRFSRWKIVNWLFIPIPEWCNREDEIELFFRGYFNVLRNGYVTWGHVVQANVLLFQEDENDCPGEVVYCCDEAATVRPESLEKLARSLFQLKDSKPNDLRLLEIAEHLTDEYTWAFALHVPVKGGMDFALSTTHFCRKYLVDGKLSYSLMPLVVCNNKSGVVVPLPKEYWPPELVLWARGVPEDVINAGPPPPDYRQWIKRVLTWDVTVASLVLFIPMLSKIVFPLGGTAAEILVVTMPVIAAIVRLLVGRKHIKENLCTAFAKLLQTIALFVAIVLMCLLDAFQVIRLTMPAVDEAFNSTDLIVFSAIGVGYFCLTLFAMYPGKGWHEAKV